MKTLKYITLIVGASLIAGCGQVETGEAGFFTRWGKIISIEPLSDGLHCYMPIGTELIIYNIKNQSIEATTDVFTKDIQSMKLKFQVTYNLDKTKIMELHAKTGKTYPNTIIVPAILGAAKDAIGKLEADKIVSERETVTRTIEDNISNDLKPHGINITFVKLLNIDYSDAFERAVEEKQVTLQESIKEKNQTARLREVAEQQVIKAEAEARSKVLNSEAEAKAILVKAEAEAKAIEMKNRALASSTALIDYTLAQQWDGKLPVQMLGTSPVPFINLNKEGTK
jgi:regulator of protease activity HflC (stomatin/prohibitin superfamily)